MGFTNGYMVTASAPAGAWLSDQGIKHALVREVITIEHPGLDAKEVGSLGDYLQRYLQPASLDLTLGRYGLFPNDRLSGICTWNPEDIEYTKVDLLTHGPDSWWTLQPGEFMLATTEEVVGLSSYVLGYVDGRSSLGRLGLLVHCSAGFIDPGFKGRITLELKNVSHQRLQIQPGQKIAQISFGMLDQPCRRPYGSEGLGSHYQGQDDVTGARGNG